MTEMSCKIHDLPGKSVVIKAHGWTVRGDGEGAGRLGESVAIDGSCKNLQVLPKPYLGFIVSKLVL